MSTPRPTPKNSPKDGERDTGRGATPPTQSDPSSDDARTSHTLDAPPAAWIPATPSDLRGLEGAKGRGNQPAHTLPSIVGGGVDTLYFSFDVEVSDAMWEHLEEEQRIAQQLASERGADHCPEWLHARLAPSGARGGYRFLIETPYWSVKLLKGIPNRPPIYVEMRAYGLRTLPGGPHIACELAAEYVREVLLADQPRKMVAEAVTLETARCSRLDLYMDWQGGWTPRFDSPALFTPNASATHDEVEEVETVGGDDEQVFIKRPHVGVGRYSVDNRLTGYEFGKGAVHARLYNKSVQARKERLDWYFEWLTQRNGSAYDPDTPVWRLEFQLQRAGVRGFALYTPPTAEDPDTALDEELDAEDLPRVSSVAKAFHWADHLFRYLTTRWLRVVRPTPDPNRGRWPEELTWTLLREGFAAQLWPPGAPSSPQQPLTHERLQLVRAQRYAGYQRVMDRMALGLLQTLDAMDTDPGAALLAYTTSMERLAHRIVERQRARVAKQAARKQRANGQVDSDELGAGERSAEPDLGRGMGGHWSSLRQAERREQLLHSALGVLVSAGVTRLTLPSPGVIRTVEDLLRTNLPELEEIAREKGGIGALLKEKWRKVYKANCPHGVFSRREMRGHAA